MPRCQQRVPPIDSIVQSVKSKLRLLLGLLAQLVSQKRECRRHRPRLRNGTLRIQHGISVSKRTSLSLTRARTWQGPFAPRTLLRFHATTNPADSRPKPNQELCLPLGRCIRGCASSGLPGSWLFVPHAPPPTTPESTSGAIARCFPVVDRLHL